MNLALLFLWHLAICLHARAYEGVPPPEYNAAADNGSLGYYPTRSYVTDEIISPETNFLKWSPECDDGLLYLITPRGWSLPWPGPMILDGRGELVWGHHFENKFGGQAYDFMVQTYQGQNYLTFWLGDDRVRGHGSGTYYMLNASYDIVHKVNGANSLSADLHEFLITSDDTALMTMYDIIPGDVTAFRDLDLETVPKEEWNYIWDCAFQEVEIQTGKLLFEWRASEHLNLTETYRDIGPGGHKGDPFDWFHINSLAKDELGNYLISARYTHSITYIDGKTKETIWQLGGKSNSFLDLSGGDSLNFAWQHDARFVPLDSFPETYHPRPQRPGYTTKLLTMFDNAAEDQNYYYGTNMSRGLLLELTYPTPGSDKALAGPHRTKSKTSTSTSGQKLSPDEEKVKAINGTDPAWTVRVVKSYHNPHDVRSSSQGSMQILQQGYQQDPKVFVGYGLNAVWTEFAANGTALCDVHFGATTSFERGDIQSYRAYKMAWTGRPETRPSFNISDDDAEVYVSWNGATDVADWVLQCSDTETDDEAAWGDVVRVRKHGFETVITLSDDDVGTARYLRVIALTESGRRLAHGTSAVIDRGIVASYFRDLRNRFPGRVDGVSSTKIFFFVVLAVSLLFLTYEVYRRYLSWRLGRPGAGPLRWRKGPAYRLLADA